MQMFFETSDGKFVNLREVASIAFEEDNYNKKKYKVIFNMNYSVSLKSNKTISDYVYSVYSNRQDFDDALYYLMNLVDEYQWIKSKDPRIINPDKISFITQDDYRNRIIINLSSSVSLSNNYDTLTSDFVYINCNNKEEFNERLQTIREAVSNLVL